MTIATLGAFAPVRCAMLAAAVILATVPSSLVILPTVSAAQSLRDAVKFHEDADELSKQGRHAEAEPLYKRALAIYEQAALEYEQEANKYKPEAKLVQKVLAVTLNNLAELYRAQARYADAEPLYKRSLAIKEKALGPNHPAVATSLQNLGHTMTRVATPTPSRSTSGPWRSKRRRSVSMTLVSLRR